MNKHDLDKKLNVCIAQHSANILLIDVAAKNGKADNCLMCQMREYRDTVFVAVIEELISFFKSDAFNYDDVINMSCAFVDVWNGYNHGMSIDDIIRCLPHFFDNDQVQSFQAAETAASRVYHNTALMNRLTKS